MKILLLVLASLSLAFGAVYEMQMNDAKIYIISLAKRNQPLEKLLPNNESQKNFIKQIAKKNPQNQHNVLLIKHKDFIALIDTGFENTQDTLKNELAKLDVDFTDITHIIITHAHGDHIGGILNNEKNNFHNAKLLIDKKEFDFWLAGTNENTKRALNAFEEKEFFDHSKPLLPSNLIIKALPAYGHTPGHNLISFEVAQNQTDTKNLVFIADLFHAYEIQNTMPDIAKQYDNDKAEAVITRKHYLKELKAQKASVVGVHTPFSKPEILP